MLIGVCGLRFEVWVLISEIWGSKFGIQGLRFVVWGLWFWAIGFWARVVILNVVSGFEI